MGGFKAPRSGYSLLGTNYFSLIEQHTKSLTHSFANFVLIGFGPVALGLAIATHDHDQCQHVYATVCSETNANDWLMSHMFGLK